MSLPTQNFISEEQLREEAVQLLGLDGVSPGVQDELVAMVGDTLFEYINIAIMRALGAEGVKQLADLEHDPDAFQKKLVELLPNIGEIIKGAIQQGLAEHKSAVSAIHAKFGLSEPAGSAQ